MTNRVSGRRAAHIAATGLRCAVGLTAPSASAAIRASISGLSEHPWLRDSSGEAVVCARDPSVDPLIVGWERMAHLAERCLDDLAEELARANSRPREIVVLLALPELRPGFDAQDAVQLQRRLASPGIDRTSIAVQLTAQGHAGALAALAAAVERVTSLRDEVIIVGAVDSYLEPNTIGWLDSNLRLLRSGIRGGFPPGEGAAFIAVASEAMCERLGLTSLARIGGIACTHETRDPASDTGLLGEALAQAVLGATQTLRLPDEPITDTYGDINGERARTEDWGFAVMRTAAIFRDATAYVSHVAQCGDVGAATAAFGCVLAAQAWKLGAAQGPRALVWAGSWTGLRAAALLEHQA